MSEQDEKQRAHGLAVMRQLQNAKAEQLRNERRLRWGQPQVHHEIAANIHWRMGPDEIPTNETVPMGLDAPR